MTIIGATSIVLAAATAAMADSPLPTADEKLVKYGDVEGWTVYKNETRHNCFIARAFGNGAVQMGLGNDNELGYLGVFTKEPNHIKNNSKQEIIVSLDGNLYIGVATGMKGHVEGGYAGGYILADDPNFTRDIAKKYDMIVFPETKAAFVVDLHGTFKAMEMGRKCNTEQMG